MENKAEKKIDLKLTRTKTYLYIMNIMQYSKSKKCFNAVR